MCEQAARYCRDGVHKLLNKEQAKLRAHDSREQPKPEASKDSECETAAQPGNSGAQPVGFDGLVRWIVTKMSNNKNISVLQKQPRQRLCLLAPTLGCQRVGCPINFAILVEIRAAPPQAGMLSW